MKTGLILEGGAMRGMFTAGVMDVMMEAGITFDGVVGVSAGAAFGCNYKSGQIGRVIRYNTRFCADRRYSGLGVLIREGNLFSTPFCYEEVPIIHDPFDFGAYESGPWSFMWYVRMLKQVNLSITDTRVGTIMDLIGSELRHLCHWFLKSLRSRGKCYWMAEFLTRSRFGILKVSGFVGMLLF